MDITWIIISLLFLCLIIILTVSNKPTQLKKHSLKMNSDFSFYDNKKEIISIRLFLENEKTNLDFLINEFKNNNIHLNKKGVFEKINNNKVMFTIANLYEPGYFKDALNIKGLTFFFITSNPIDNKKTLSIMFRLANKINKKINGKIYSDQGKILNEMNYQEMLGQHNTQN